VAKIITNILSNKEQE